MKRLTVTLLMMTLGAGMLLAQTQNKATDAKKTAASATAAADELKQIENDWVDASKTKNADKLGAILADSWVALGWDGKRTDKAKALAELKSPGNALDRSEEHTSELQSPCNLVC